MSSVTVISWVTHEWLVVGFQLTWYFDLGGSFHDLSTDDMGR